MGLCAEKTVNDMKISREIQDDFCINSYERLIAAIKSGKLKNEIIDIEIQNSTKDKPTVFNEDEEYIKYNVKNLIKER